MAATALDSVLRATNIATGDENLSDPSAPLPTVRWGEHDISRILVGHNPIKGGSHLTRELSREMGDFHRDSRRGLELLLRCRQCGINTCQIGGTAMESLLRQYYETGQDMKWIPTFYSSPGAKAKEELKRILQMRPRPIGIQHFGGTTDRLMTQGKLDEAQETLKMCRDAGLMVGLCTHNHEVIDYAANRDWDVDFYMGSFYRVSYDIRNTGRAAPKSPGEEYFEEEARKGMIHTIRQVDKPCIAFKVLGAGRHCKTQESVRRAIQYTFDMIKPTDVVLLGMWQKHRDQVGEDTKYAIESMKQS